MVDTKKRRIFPVLNKYQKTIILSIFIPIIMMHLCLFGMLTFLHVDLTRLLLGGVYPENIAVFVDHWSMSLLILSISFILIALLVSFIISRGLVGAFDRIIGELDEVIDGKRDQSLIARDYDVLVKELLTRINKLIEERKPKE